LGPLELAVLAAPLLWVVLAILHPGGVGAALLSGLFAAHNGYAAAVGLVTLFLAELLRFGTPSGEAAPSRAPEPV
jgi:hypothetical protein